MSLLRSRSSRRRAERTPGILRGTRLAQPDAERVIEHGIRNQLHVNWRLVSGLMVIALSVVLFIFFATDLFYVRSISVGGVQYLDESEIFRYAEIAEMHVFWIDPEEVQERLVNASEVIADANVVVGWPPNMIRIFIEEREPQLIWVQAGVTALVDLHGGVLRYPGDDESLPDLMRVVAVPSVEGPPGADTPISSGAVTGALQMQEIGFQGELIFHPVKGLGFREAGGWDVWLGVGADMPNKLKIYEELRDYLLTQGITPAEINVSDLNGVYYCGVGEGCL